MASRTQFTVLLPLLTLMSMLITAAQTHAEDRPSPAESAGILFEDSMTGDWRDQWFLDGEKANLTQDENGLHFQAGSEPDVQQRRDESPEMRRLFDSYHAVLWTQQEFEGEIGLSFEMTRTSEGFTFLLYMLAQGVGWGPYPRDITEWNDLRAIPSMDLYHDGMNLTCVTFRQQIRLRRYPWKNEAGQGFNDTRIGEFIEYDRIRVGNTYHVDVELRTETLRIRIKEVGNPDNAIDRTFNRVDDLDPRRQAPSARGRIGIRHMIGTGVRYRNVQVRQLCRADLKCFQDNHPDRQLPLIHHRTILLFPNQLIEIMKTTRSHPAVTSAGKFAAMIVMILALSSGAYGQAEPEVPFDLEKFQPVLSECRLHSPRTSRPIAVSNGNFGGYELPARFYLGEAGSTMVLATTNNNRDRTELRHNSSWSLLGEEKRISARLRFDKPVALGGGKSRLHLMQVYGTGAEKGPTVLISWAGSWDADGSDDSLQAYVKGSRTHDLGLRPDGFFNLDVSVKEGVVRIYIDNELKVEDDVSNKDYAAGNFYFKTGTYHRGIESHAVEFESLSITTP